MGTKSEKVESVRLLVEAPSVQGITFTIGGLRPNELICARPPNKVPKRGPKVGTVGGPVPGPADKKAVTPEELFLASMYPHPDKEGCYVFPADGLLKCWATAMMRFYPIDPKYPPSTLAIFYGAVQIPDALIEIESDAPRMRHDQGRTKRKELLDLYRGGFRNWKMIVPAEFDASLITADMLASAVNRGGFSVGIGAWRPEHCGRFGRFQILNVKGGKKGGKE